MHQFAIGRQVQLRQGAADAHIPAGTYSVVRQMPSETRDMQYRIKHLRDGHERVVRESQLGPASSGV